MGTGRYGRSRMEDGMGWDWDHDAAAWLYLRRAAEEEWDRLSCYSSVGLGRGAQGWDVCNEHAGTRWSWHRCRRVGGKKSPCLARVGAEKWHNHVPETVPQAEKGLWHITRAVQETQGMMELQVWLQGSQSNCEQGPELN